MKVFLIISVVIVTALLFAKNAHGEDCDKPSEKDCSVDPDICGNKICVRTYTDYKSENDYSSTSVDCLEYLGDDDAICGGNYTDASGQKTTLTYFYPACANYMICVAETEDSIKNGEAKCKLKPGIQGFQGPLG